jgi:hypothetical protein
MMAFEVVKNSADNTIDGNDLDIDVFVLAFSDDIWNKFE